MILMGIVLRGTENQIWGDASLQTFKYVFYLCPCIWQESISERLQHYSRPRLRRQTRSQPFAPPPHEVPIALKHHPVKNRARIFLGQVKDRTSAPDLDVIGMRAYTEDMKGSGCVEVEV